MVKKKTFPKLSDRQKDNVARLMQQDRARKQFDSLGQGDTDALSKALTRRIKSKRKVN